MDFSEVKLSERVIDILHPKTGEESGIKVTLLSIEDAKLKRVKRKIRDERMRLEARGKSFKSEDEEENLDNLLFAAMTGWSWGGEAVWRGEKPEFNLKNVRDVFENFVSFRQQIAEAVEDTSAFL